MAERMTDQEFVTCLVQQLVDRPEAVRVDRTVDHLGVLLTLSVAPEDMGIVIGRDGSTAKAIRTLLRIFGARADARVNLKISEPDGGERAAATPRAPQRSHDDRATEDEVPTRKTIDEVVGDLSNLS